MSLLKSRFIEMFGNVATNNKRWEKTKLGNKSVIGSSKRIFANEYTSEGIPFYRSKEIIELGMGEKPSVELYISKKRYQEIKEKFGIPIPGDILMTAVGTIGKFWIVPNSKPFYYKDGNLVYIRTKEFNPLFLKKLLEMLIEKYKVENANGSAYTALTIEKLKDLQIVLPPMTLQKQYEEFHIQIDKSKFLLQQILEKFELLKKSRFIEMFGNLGNHHKDWKIAKFENFCEINPNKKSIENIEDSTEVSFIPMAAVSEKGEIDTSETKTYSEVKKGFTSFSDKDVLFAKITPCMENGKGAVAEGLKNNLGFGSTEFHVLRPKQELCDSYWLYYLMSLPEFRKKAELNMKGSAGQKRVPANFLAKFEISLPPIGLQKVYIDFFNQIDKSKLIIQKALEDLVGKV